VVGEWRECFRSFRREVEDRREIIIITERYDEHDGHDEILTIDVTLWSTKFHNSLSESL
jgi:hypothetical protein